MTPHSNRKGGLEAQVRAAARLREALFGPFSREDKTDAYRLLNGEGDGLPGFLVDVYAGYLVVQVLARSALRSAPALEEALDQVLKPRGIVRKLRYAEEGRGQVPVETSRGKPPPAIVQVKEDGIPYAVELLRGLHTGLFTDLREERTRLRRLARGRRVLNTFAYTGAFSVAAAVGGAAVVTSVDVVRKVLDRAEKNFALSGIDASLHHFVRMEVLEFLRLAKRRGWRYEAIVLDPPTFSTFKSGRWSVRSYPELLDLSLDLLEPEGFLWAAANTERLRAESFEAQIRRAVATAGRGARVLAVGGLPPDHPTPLDSPASRYLKVFVLQVF